MMIKMYILLNKEAFEQETMGHQIGNEFWCGGHTDYIPLATDLLRYNMIGDGKSGNRNLLLS
jgi:hypothetical protein